MVSGFDVLNFFEDCRSNCSRMQDKHFDKGKIITTYIEKRNQVCMLLSGSADLIRYDYNGNKTIVEHFIPKDIFGEVFYHVNTNNELFVLAKENSEVLIFNYIEMEEKCRKNCPFHQKLMSNLQNLFLDKIVNMNIRIEILSKRSIREKLITYFSTLSTRQMSKTFLLPFSLTDLADYLSVDRSAMMRELKLLKEDGFIKKNGNKITLAS